MEDGQIQVIELTHYMRRDARVIDVGDSVATESDLIKDIVSGTLHTAVRKAARKAVKDAEN